MEIIIFGLGICLVYVCCKDAKESHRSYKNRGKVDYDSISYTHRQLNRVRPPMLRQRDSFLQECRRGNEAYLLAMAEQQGVPKALIKRLATEILTERATQVKEYKFNCEYTLAKDAIR